ncbi:hypothetical protein GOODEAATRI_026969, partial [Goodea atripinnis]
EALERAAGEQREEEQTSVSPLKFLDHMIVHGNDAHERLSRRFSAGTKSMDRSHLGGKQQSMKSRGEEPQALKSQLLLVHSQLQYERFKRQQHAIRNRRLLRRVINVTALEEQTVAMSELLENRSRLKDLEAELQRANNKANHAEHLLTQLSLKEEAMLQRSMGKEFQRLKDCNVQQKQKLEAANHRIAELENQLAKKEKLILDQKKLLEDTKNQNRSESRAEHKRLNVKHTRFDMKV